MTGNPSSLGVSVIVRCKDKVGTITETMDALARQTVAPEIIVVDSGSTDGTLDIVRSRCDVLVQIAPADFTYGGALNEGASRATGDVCFALSAHCAPASGQWIAWALEAYEDPLVAATAGLLRDPLGLDLAHPTSFGIEELQMGTNPFWGMSNHASSWRRDVWLGHPFEAHLGACEDLEWMWAALHAGWKVTADPRLYVDGQHRRAEGLRALFRRQYRERLALAEILEYPPISGGRALREWWGTFPYPSRHPNWQRRLSPWRTTELLSEFVGDQVGAQRRRRGKERG